MQRHVVRFFHLDSPTSLYFRKQTRRIHRLSHSLARSTHPSTPYPSPPGPDPMAARNLNRPTTPIPSNHHPPSGNATGEPGAAPAVRRTKRGKLKLKRIEDKNIRQASFSKRRNGLFKKARELAVLCDVDAALIVFSPNGRLFEHSSGDSLKNIIERYQIRMDEERAVARKSIHEVQPNLTGFPESSDFSEGSNLLNPIRRQLEEGNIDKLSTEELGQLEEQLDDVLRKTRSRKEQRLRAGDEHMQTKLAALDEECQEDSDRFNGSLEIKSNTREDQMNNCPTSPGQQPMVTLL